MEGPVQLSRKSLNTPAIRRHRLSFPNIGNQILTLGIVFLGRSKMHHSLITLITFESHSAISSILYFNLVEKKIIQPVSFSAGFHMASLTRPSRK